MASVTVTIDSRADTRGFATTIAALGALRAAASRVSTGLASVGSAVLTMGRNLGTVRTGLRVAGIAAGVLAARMTAASRGMGAMSGTVAGLAQALRTVGATARTAARSITRVLSAVAVAGAVGKLIGSLTRLGKSMAVAVLGGSVVVGMFAALGVAASSAAASVGLLAAGAIATLGPALAVAKIGFQGMSDAAAAWRKQLTAADREFSLMIAGRMEPFLTAMRNMKQSVTDSMTTAMIPAFQRFGAIVTGLTPTLSGFGATIGEMFNRVADAIPTDALDVMVANSRSFVATLSPGIAGLVAGMTRFGAAASQAFSAFGPQASAGLQALGDRLAAIKPERIAAAFRTLSQTISNIGAVLGPIVGLLSQLGSIAGASLAPGFAAIGAAVSQATPALSEIAQKLFPALAQVMQNLAPALPAIVQAFSPWASVLAAIAPPLASMAAALAPLAPYLAAAAIAAKAMAAALAIYNTIALAVSNATKIWTGIQWAWNAAMAANPIGLIVLAIAALVAIIVVIATKTTWFQTIWKAMCAAAVAAWNWIKSAVSAFVAWITGVWQSLVSAGTVAWNAIKAAAEIVWNAIMAVVNAVISAITSYINNCVMVATAGWNMISSAASTVWNFISGIVSTVAGVISSAIGSAVDFVTGAFSTLQGIAETVWGAISSVIDTVAGAISTVVGWVKQLIEWISNISWPSPPSWMSAIFGGATALPVPYGQRAYMTPAWALRNPSVLHLADGFPSVSDLGGTGRGTTVVNNYDQSVTIKIDGTGIADPQAVAQAVTGALGRNAQTRGLVPAMRLGA